MCYFQGKSVGKYCSLCQNCSCYLFVCITYVTGSCYAVGECDNVDFCNEYCPMYSEYEELWGKVVL